MDESNPQLRLPGLESIYDSAPVGLCLFDTKLRFLRVNERLAEMNGVPASHHISRTVREVVPDLADQAEAVAKKIIDTGLPVLNVEFTGKTPAQPDVPRRWLESWLPVKDSSGKVVEINVVVEEVTEQKRMEEALRKSEEKFRRLFEDDLTGDFIANEDGIILECNPAFLHMFRYKNKAEAVGENITVLYPEPSERVSILDKLRATGKLENYETIRKRKDGSLITVMENIVATFDQGGKLIEVKAYMYDITERKQLEEALRTSRDELELRVQERTAELERSNNELQDFAFIASHDLQEPLRKIQTFGDLVVRKYSHSLDEQGQDFLRRMQNAAARMQALIEALLAYSRVATKAKPFTPVDLKLAVREALSDLELRIEDTGATVELSDLPSIEADSSQMTQLFQNLISNAIKFHRPEEPPRIKIFSRTEAGWCEIYVEDNGIGFPETHSKRIFTPFERLHGNSKYEGVGMGLAICRKIAERHGGKITVRSEVGKGSTFIVTLPENRAVQ
jgi:PAS domain S-box-containing protein